MEIVENVTVLRNGEIRQAKRNLKLMLSFDYGENTSTISEKVTLEIIKKTMKFINWNEFHTVQLEEENSKQYKALHLSGSLGKNGLAS